MSHKVTDLTAPVRRAWRRIAAAVFPWPPKAEREAALESARAQLRQSQQDRREAERLAAQTAPLIAWLTAELARRRAERASAGTTTQGGAR